MRDEGAPEADDSSDERELCWLEARDASSRLSRGGARLPMTIVLCKGLVFALCRPPGTCAANDNVIYMCPSATRIAIVWYTALDQARVRDDIL